MIRGIRSDSPSYLHAAVGIVQTDTALNNDFKLAVDRLSQYVSTRSPNVDFFRGTQVRGGRNVSSVTGGGRGGGRGGGIFEYGQGEGKAHNILETYKLTMMDMDTILSVWLKKIRFWKTFTTRMKIQ